MSDAAAVLAELKFDEHGLVAAIAQQHDTGEVLMLAWMNREAVERDARHRPRLLLVALAPEAVAQGRESGQVQRLVELRVDCDGDAVLLLRRQTASPATPAGAIASSAPARRQTRDHRRARWSIPPQLYGETR